MPVNSPVTLRFNTEQIEKIPVQLIIDGYRDLLSMDVSSYFTGLDHISICRCKDTGFRFYYPETIFGDAGFYAELQKWEFYYNEWNWEHARAASYIKPGHKVLEVGCGTGYFLEGLKKRGLDGVGLELNNDAVEVCKQKGLNVANELVEEHSAENPGKYDIVCAFQVLEHVYNVHSFIVSCINCLKPGGKLIFAVPNNNPWFYKYDKYHTLNMPPHHSGLWDKATFRKLSSWFTVNVERVTAEPLYNRRFFLQLYLQHKKYNRLWKIIEKIRPGILNRLLWPLSWFNQGKCLLAVMEKR